MGSQPQIANRMPRLSLSRSTQVRSLHRKKGRSEERAFLAEGERLLEELAGVPERVRYLFGTRDRVDWLMGRFPDAEVYEIDGEGNRLFATENAQGVGGVVEMPEPATAADIAAVDAPVIFLDRLADPGNAGTILRTAEWFGAAGVLFGEGSVDPYNPKVVRATMGAIFRLPIALDVPIAALHPLEIPLHALDAGGEEQLGMHPLPVHAIYAVGSEAHGVSAELRPHARLLRIAGGGGGESLNAAIAASILLYEIFRGSST